MSKLLLGPVLSFRGLGTDGSWKVTALVGIEDQARVPQVTVEGRKAGKPVTLLQHAGRTYLRYDLSCKLRKNERRVPYSIEGVGEAWHFTVPGKGYAPRMAYVSCNGFSDPGGMRKLVKAENAVWADLLCNHDKEIRPPGYELDKEQLWHEARTHDQGNQRFHLMLMGGDQIYFDSIWEDIKLLKRWIGLTREEQLQYPVDADLEKEIEDYYFRLYSERWLPHARSGWGSADKPLDAAQAMARIPTVMMWDDHDIFDGWGSYSLEMQRSPLFQRLFFMRGGRSGSSRCSMLSNSFPTWCRALTSGSGLTIHCSNRSSGLRCCPVTSLRFRYWTSSLDSHSRIPLARSA
jgi:Hypothetical protein